MNPILVLLALVVFLPSFAHLAIALDNEGETGLGITSLRTATRSRTPEKIWPSTSRAPYHAKASQTRLILMLVAVSCLSMAIAVGVIANGIARARAEDNRLSISNSTMTRDALSAVFARVARDVEPCVAHTKVYESEVYVREG